MLIDPTNDEDITDHYYDAFVNVIRQRHGVRLEFHLVDPSNYEPGLQAVGYVIPSRAKPFLLHD